LTAVGGIYDRLYKKIYDFSLRIFYRKGRNGRAADRARNILVDVRSIRIGRTVWSVIFHGDGSD